MICDLEVSKNVPLYSPPQMRVIMATIDERLSFSLLLFPLQKMTFHWVLVQKSNDLSPSPRKHLLTKAPSLLQSPCALLATPLAPEKLVQHSLVQDSYGKNVRGAHSSNAAPAHSINNFSDRGRIGEATLN